MFFSDPWWRTGWDAGFPFTFACAHPAFCYTHDFPKENDIRALRAALYLFAATDGNAFLRVAFNWRGGVARLPQR
jgi:hypothetical protein